LKIKSSQWLLFYLCIWKICLNKKRKRFVNIEVNFNKFLFLKWLSIKENKGGKKEILERINKGIIQIKPWEDKDLDLLFQINQPEMMEHLGGPESKEEILNRHNRYLNLSDKGCMFSIKLLPDFKTVGSVGYWQTVWNGESVYEIGWSVLPNFQGKGIATNE